ncbi:MAG TPA: hypothetical protein VFC78_13510 [Tepidisphaeraceae bacterium]|nr:hypothetical protein [Tepidisphaeraceae bacterium]
MVVDDLDGDMPQPVFQRYRGAVDGILRKPGFDSRAAVHFLVSMVEAYYFAHSQAVNNVAGRNVLESDHPTDVEMIRHPKGKLKQLWPDFRERVHGQQIIRILDLSHVLHRPTECCWLRALIAWCVDRIRQENAFYGTLEPTTYCLGSGCKSPTSYPQ